MITKYRAWRDFKIEKVEVVKETEHTVTVKNSGLERREAKFSEYQCYFDTWAEAKQHMVSVAEGKVRRAEANLVSAENKLKDVLEYKEGNE